MMEPIAMSDPILIVGAGPTGLTAALELSRLGIPVRLIEKALEPSTTSRAIGVQARTLELLQQRGLAEEMVHLGNPATQVDPGTRPSCCRLSEGPKMVGQVICTRALPRALRKK
jgi:2-polyprenyl-6-methoxyphenol hydroxylase-like FAD-dependent oxidoreductase